MSVNQVNRQPNYSDLDLNFVMNPATGDVSIKKGEDAIKRSIANLLKTNFYDRPFQPGIGSDINALLFESTNSASQVILERVIRLCIENFEPRVRVQNITVSYDPDENGFNIRLEYIILNNNLPVVSTLFLERIR